MSFSECQERLAFLLRALGGARGALKAIQGEDGSVQGAADVVASPALRRRLCSKLTASASSSSSASVRSGTRERMLTTIRGPRLPTQAVMVLATMMAPVLVVYSLEISCAIRSRTTCSCYDDTTRLLPAHHTATTLAPKNTIVPIPTLL